MGYHLPALTTRRPRPAGPTDLNLTLNRAGMRIFLSDPSVWIAVLAALLSGYVSALHLALRGFNRIRLTELLEARGQSARYELLTERTDKLLLMTGTLRTVFNIILLLAVLHLIDRAFPWDDWIKYLAAFVVTTLVICLVGVAIPTSLSLHLPEKLLSRSARCLDAALRVFTPFVAVLEAVDPLVRKVSRADVNRPEENGVSAEVMSVVEEHTEEGEVDPVQKKIITAAFELPVTTAGEIMTPRTEVQAIPAHATLADAGAAILRDGHSRVPVYEKTIDNVIGILFAKDLIQFLTGAQAFSLRKVVRPPLLVPATKSVRELLAEFKARKMHMAIVLDEYGGTAGLVTIEDILEELVGEIQDEHEQAAPDEPMIRWLDGRTAEVDGRVHIDDLAGELGLVMPEGADYDTVGGFVFSTLGHIPAVGETFDHANLRFTVTDAKRTRVERVRVEKIESEKAPEEPLEAAPEK